MGSQLQQTAENVQNQATEKVDQAKETVSDAAAQVTEGIQNAVRLNEEIDLSAGLEQGKQTLEEGQQTLEQTTAGKGQQPSSMGSQLQQTGEDMQNQAAEKVDQAKDAVAKVTEGIQNAVRLDEQIDMSAGLEEGKQSLEQTTGGKTEQSTGDVQGQMQQQTGAMQTQTEGMTAEVNERMAGTLRLYGEQRTNFGMGTKVFTSTATLLGAALGVGGLAMVVQRWSRRAETPLLDELELE